MKQHITPKQLNEKYDRECEILGICTEIENRVGTEAGQIMEGLLREYNETNNHS